MMLATIVIGAVVGLPQEVPYERLATRRETEAAAIATIQEMPNFDWGPWFQLSAFPGSEKGMMGVEHPPERELARMVAGGPGPDLARTYRGKTGEPARWTELDIGSNQTISLNTHNDADLDTNSTAYLYRTVTADRAGSIKATMGSDDGLRFWLNGELRVDADVPRGLDPNAHELRLEFEEGVNHLFVKVTQGQGGWAYQLNSSAPLDRQIDARLQYRLDRDFPTTEQAFYPDVTIPVPDDIVLEVGGLGFLSDGRIVCCTRRGDVYLVDDWTPDQPFEPVFTRFASGLHEPLGVAVRRENGNDAVFCVQRAELTRLEDTDGDDVADRYTTVCDQWGVSGGYHEFSFGPKFDKNGDAWVTLNIDFCGGLGKSIVPYRGWALKVSPDGTMTPVCDGLRSPNGIGVLPNGDAFYVDNQGDFVGTNRLSHLAPDSWHGHPATLGWREGWSDYDPKPERARAAVWFPYGRMGQSAADITLDDTGGKFGPFDGQFFVGDQFSALVMRVCLEQIDGEYQGACFPFRANLDCGVNRIAFDPAGRMVVGETDRGWTSQGRLRFGLERITWSGETPFEPLTMHAAPDGFVVTFTKDIDIGTASDPESYDVTSFTYRYHSNYGSPEIERESPEVTAVRVLGDRAVHLTLSEMRAGGEGYVHEIEMPGVRSDAGEPLVHPVGYYTLVRVPDEMPSVSTRRTGMVDGEE